VLGSFARQPGAPLLAGTREGLFYIDTTCPAWHAVSMAQNVSLELFEELLERAASQLDRTQTLPLSEWLHEYEHRLRAAVEECEQE